jgi:hypothetical protein
VLAVLRHERRVTLGALDGTREGIRLLLRADVP